MMKIQPMKMSAAEALWESENPASMSLFTIGNEAERKDVFALKVPGLLSFLAYNRFEGEVKGINQLQDEYVQTYGPGNYVPPVAVSYWTFRLMAGAGFAMLFLSLWGLWAVMKGKTLDSPLMLKLTFWGIALVLMLLALITRAVSFDYRSKDESPTWRSTWDWIICVTSFLPALLWGVAMSNLIRGVPINQDMTYVGGFFTLLNPFCLVGGLAAVAVFALHGAVFLALKTGGGMEVRARSAASKLWLPAVILLGLYVGLFVVATDVIEHVGYNPGVVPIMAVIALLLVKYFLGQKREGWAFIMTGIAIIFANVTIFLGLFPRLMVSSLNPEWSLTIYNASASQYTLKVMSIVAVGLLPFILTYQAWSYWVFRKRITVDTTLVY